METADILLISKNSESPISNLIISQNSLFIVTI